MMTGTTFYNWSIGWMWGTTTMNCADFAAAVLEAAGADVSSGLLNMPSAVSAPDHRSADQIYRDAADRRDALIHIG
ncbi:MAG TPA: hypothetical protein VEX86_00960 [Longimicrobium sp.]|nr:hypothetical protein [Longimicrobium sp.]